jgi:hypothetical protein
MLFKRTMMLAAIAALAVAVSAPARASDLPVKALPAVAPSYSFNNSGFFVGLFTEGGGSSVSANVPGVASASLTTTTAAFGVTAGYAKKFGNNLTGTIEADSSFTNFNGNNAGFALSGPLSFEQRAMVFMPLTTLTNAFSFLNIQNPFGNLAQITVPAGFTVTNTQFGFGAGVYEKDMTLAYQGVGSNKVWRVDPEIVAMLQDTLSNGTVLRTFVKTDFPDKGAVFGAKGSSATLAPGVRAGIGFMF